MRFWNNIQVRSNSFFFSKPYHLKKTKAKGPKQNSKTLLYLIEINIIYTLGVPKRVQSRVTDHTSNHYPRVLSGEYRSVFSRVTDHVSNHYPPVLSGEYRSVFSHVSLTMLVIITHLC
jgi:hypothetical protein